ncbi:RNase adapter RapZ [Lactobacillus sp. YT155]|uniref:RNase adapter RapZ n=1 Tax=Lactobacillus sp. YT155 TaxID=3060955 RepID=UPI00265EFCAD|nr:RNase adapter RapZ [Lactobacillus sp. YT155]MDO1605109.1 RNase adapter RapZ [Lactobacillus sp. YT155]
MEETKLVVVTGMSGAGKTVAMRALEDMGYFCIDNMPPALFSKFWELVQESGKVDKIALVVDLRSRGFYERIVSMISELRSEENVETRIMFLDASDEELVARYKETRRAHPLVTDGGRLLDGVKKERQMLEEIKRSADLIIDTTDTNTRQLREKIIDYFKDNDKDTLFRIEVMSFGFKYGIPIDADNVVDVRFLPNPFYIPELKPLSGLDEPVADYVFDSDESQNFYKQYLELMKSIIPGYQKEGKSSLTIAVGCTGGQHRSVAIAEKLGHDLRAENYKVEISHRDREKSQFGGN